MSRFTDALLEAARGWIGHTEVTRNSSPEIDLWLDYVHQPPGKPWCAAWVCGMHRQAAVALGVPNPCPRTAGALRLWELADAKHRTQLPAPGDVFVLDTGEPGGAGHVGIVEECSPDGRTITTIEGNSDERGGREGLKVCRHTWRTDLPHRGKLIGFLSLAPADTIESERRALGLDALPESPFK